MTGYSTFDYTDSEVLVTGGTSGIGLGIATAFAEAGARVHITGTRLDPLTYDLDLSRFHYHQCVMTETQQVAELPHALHQLDVLVNNAGANFPRGVSEWEPDAFDESVQINLLSAFRLAVGCKDLLSASQISGGGSVIGVASMAAFEAVPMVPGYGAAKAGIVQMAMSLAAEWSHIPIRSNAIAPGLIDTGMTRLMKEIDGLADPFIERTPLKRWGTPADIAPAVLFLASQEARFITGHTLMIDGGYSSN